MTGFIPEGLVPVADYLKDKDAAAVGVALASGALVAMARAPGGVLSAVPASLWRGSEARSILESGTVPPRLMPGAKGGPSGEVLIRLPKDRPVTPRLGAALKDAGGRPRAYDWEAALLELVRLDAETGTANKTTADLVRHLLEWFGRQGKHPSEPLVRQRVQKYRAASGADA